MAARCPPSYAERDCVSTQRWRLGARAALFVPNATGNSTWWRLRCGVLRAADWQAVLLFEGCQAGSTEHGDTTTKGACTRLGSGLEDVGAAIAQHGWRAL